MDTGRAQRDSWSRWTKARFLTMPATRHSFTHLNQARRIRERLKL